MASGLYADRTIRCSARSRRESRVNIRSAPASQVVTTTVAFRATIRPTSPAGLNGLAQNRYADRDLSRIAPNGKTKLSDVATQIQYFTVALPRPIDVRRRAATQTSEAFRRWTVMWYAMRAMCSCIGFYP